MRLTEYLDREGLTQIAFGRRLGLRRSTMNAYVTGGRRPPVEVVAAIAEATGGAVLAADLVGRSPPAITAAPFPSLSRQDFLAGVAEAQAILRRHVGHSDCLSDELIRERRAEMACA